MAENKKFTVCLLYCPPDFYDFLKEKTRDLYIFNLGNDDAYHWFDDIIIADREKASVEEWQRFLEIRFVQGRNAGWLILLDEQPYELLRDTRLCRAKTKEEVLNLLLELYYTLK